MDKFIEGELVWCKTKTPEEYEGKKSWSVTVYPTKESLEIVREMQSEGIKNKVKKDPEKGWFVKFSRPTERKNAKTGKVIQTFEAPFTVNSDGAAIQGLVGNGSLGVVKVDLYEHAVKGGGTSKAARLEGITLTKYIPFGDVETPKVETAPPPNYF